MDEGTRQADRSAPGDESCLTSGTAGTQLSATQPSGTQLKSIMICGAGHSGSTLLGMILGLAPGAFYIGEGAKIRYLHDQAKPLRKRVCKICGEDCPIWSRFTWDREDSLYPQIARHVGASTIVDSTKNPAWITERAQELRAAGGLPILLMLMRDGRAVVNSRIRKYPERDPRQQIEDWMAQIARSQALFEEFPGPKMAVHYEELAEQPERVVRAICDLAGLEFVPAMLDFTNAEHHPLGGNNGTQYLAAKAMRESGETAIATPGARSRDYYEKHRPVIALDLRWKQELSAEHAALFQDLAGEANQAMKLRH